MRHHGISVRLDRLGDGGSARAQSVEVRRRNPGFSIAWLQAFVPDRNSADPDFPLDGLCKAGLPA